jgi:hypothetical protein
MRNLQVFFVLVSLTFIILVNPTYSDSQNGNSIHSTDLTTYIDANDIFMFVNNQGGFGQDIADYFGAGYQYGTFYPYISVDSIFNGSMIKSPLYAAGIWLGGMVNSQVRVALSEFSSEFWPGPMIGNSFDSAADTTQSYRVYKIFSDSAESNPNTDYLEWPVADGAPTDSGGKPLFYGDQTLWSVYNDANPARHALTAGSSAPLGVEVQNTVWASDSVGKERVIYLEYRLFNRSDSDITNFYCSIWMDPDLGYFEDDLTACDSLQGIFYCYNASDSDIVYGTAPPALGVKMLAGPIVDSPGDSAYFFGQYVQDYRNLPMSSFVSYPNGDDPQSSAESYNIMQGLKRNGNPLDNGTKFSFPGDPVTGTGDVAMFPDNPHYLGSFGPLDFPAGDSQYVLVKLGIGQGTDRLNSITDMFAVLNSFDSLGTDISDYDRRNLPEHFELEQNYPNPFNPETTIGYSLSTKDRVCIEIYNLLGQRVRTLADEVKSAGNYSIKWDGRSSEGLQLGSGIYLYRMQVGDFVQSRKMLLLK